MDRPTILVIDYEPRNLAATVEPLTAAGYHVEVARDGVAGLDAFRRLQPPVVFMEAMLPKKHAFEVCQEIRRAQPGRKTRVFILGAPTIAQSQQMKAVHQYGADRFLARPVDGQTLLSLCSPVLPGPDAPQVREIDLLEDMESQRAAAAEREILASLAAPQPPVGRLELSAMSEDDIMAQLDQLLPSVVAPAPAPPVRPAAAAPRVAARPAVAPAPVRPVPVKTPGTKAPVRVPQAPVPPRAAVPASIPVQLPPPESRPAHALDAAPAPRPTRSRLPLVLVGGVLTIAAFGSWMLFRPGAAPVAEPVQALPFSEEAALDIAEPLSAAPSADVVAAPATTAANPPTVSVVPKPTPPPAPTVAKEAAVAEKPAPPSASPKVTAARTAPPETAEPGAQAEASGPAPARTVEEWIARSERPPEIPLPLAPPRLEPLPVGSDAARPRISPDVFLPRTEAGSLVELSEADKAPIPISRPAPAYPPTARQMRREGEIELRLLVDAQGQVAAVERLTGGKSDLAAAAERAARQWRYRPAMKDGVPVQVKIVEKIAFKL